MTEGDLQTLTKTILGSFTAGMVFSFLLILIILYAGWKWTNGRWGKSPFTGANLKLGSELTFDAANKVSRYMLDHSSDQNPGFDITRAAICPDTGRIFPNAIGELEIPKVSKNYLVHLAKGEWTPVSSLSDKGKERLINHVEDFSSYAQDSLYIDLNTATLIGWKRVPGTSLQLLIKTPIQE